MTAICLNFYGGPGCGKSTMSAAVFSALKWHGVNCELVNEYAKQKVWEGSLNVLENQIYLLGKQHHRQFILRNKVDVMITDSPLLLLLEYGRGLGENFAKLVLELYGTFNNYNIFLERCKSYDPVGRLQTEDEAKEIDRSVLNVLVDNEIIFNRYPGTPDSVDSIANKIMRSIA